MIRRDSLSHHHLGIEQTPQSCVWCTFEAGVCGVRKHVHNRTSWLLFLRFSKTRELWSSKAAFNSQLRFPLLSVIITIASNKPWNKETDTKWIKIHQVQIINCDLLNLLKWSKLLFPKSFAKMVDRSKEHKHQLAFELQNLCIFEKLSKIILL